MKDFPTSAEVRGIVAEHVDISNADSFAGGSVDDTGTILKYVLGYRFNSYLGIELSYVDLGEGSSSWSASDFRGFPFFAGGNVGTNLDYKVTSIGLSALVQYPIEDYLSIYARLGTHFYDSETKASWFAEGLAYPDTRASETTDDSGTEFLWGLGLDWNFSDHWSLRCEWETYEATAMNDHDINVELLSAGLYYRF